MSAYQGFLISPFLFPSPIHRAIRCGIRGWTGGENFQLLLVDTSILNNDGAVEIARDELKVYLTQEDIAVILEKRLFCLCRLGRDQEEFQKSRGSFVYSSQHGTVSSGQVWTRSVRFIPLTGNRLMNVSTCYCP